MTTNQLWMRMLVTMAITATLVFLLQVAFHINIGYAIPLGLAFCGAYTLISKKKVTDADGDNKKFFVIIPIFCFVGAAALLIFETVMIMQGR